MMTFISTLKTAIRPRRGADERIADLDSKTRTEIALDIQIVHEEQAQELKQIDQELETAREHLKAAEKKAKFVQTRVESYRRALDAQARKLQPPTEYSEDEDMGTNKVGGMTVMGCPVGVPGYEAGAPVQAAPSEDEEDPVETAPEEPQMSEEERLRKLAKLQEQEVAWGKANMSFEMLKNQVREFHKRILVLQKKRNDIVGLEEENKDYVVQAAAVPDDEDFLQQLNRLRVEENVDKSSPRSDSGKLNSNHRVANSGQADNGESSKLIS